MAAPTTNPELMAAIRGLSAARELPPEIILDALKAALRSAYDKIPDRPAGEVTVEISESTGATRVFGHYSVMEPEHIDDPDSQMTLEQAREHDEDVELGDSLVLDVTPDDFGRIAAQTAKQVILQRIREAEREQTYLTYADREGEIVYGTVQSTNRDVVTIALDRVEAIMPRREQIPGERYSPNQRVRVYVAEVKRAVKGPQIIVSRAHKQMLLRLMELEIPEIFQGAVEIKAIAREAGSRSKVAVHSLQEGVDPVGACVGMRGVRIQTLVRELGGEKVDIVEWDPDPRAFIKHALSPARVMFVALEPPEDDTVTMRGTAAVIVPDDQLSLAIGREGQNARLAAKLTGWRIDIRAESESAELLEKLRAEDEVRRAERARRAAAKMRAAAETEEASEEASEEDELEVAPTPPVEEPAAAALVEEAEEELAEIVETTAESGPAEEQPVEAVAEADADAPTESAPADEAVEEATVERAAATDEEPPSAEVVAEPDTEDVEPAAEDVAPEEDVEAPAARVEPSTEPDADAGPAERTQKRQPPAESKRDDWDAEELWEDEDDEDGARRKRRGRRLIRDPKTGRLVAEKRRKRSRRDWRDEVDQWTGEADFEFDEDEMQFTEDDFLGESDGDEGEDAVVASFGDDEEEARPSLQVPSDVAEHDDESDTAGAETEDGDDGEDVEDVETSGEESTVEE